MFLRRRIHAESKPESEFPNCHVERLVFEASSISTVGVAIHGRVDGESDSDFGLVSCGRTKYSRGLCNGLGMTFGEGLPTVGQQIKIKWGGPAGTFEVEWIDYGTLKSIQDIGQVSNESWLLTSDRYQNSVVRYYDLWEMVA